MDIGKAAKDDGETERDPANRGSPQRNWQRKMVFWKGSELE